MLMLMLILIPEQIECSQVVELLNLFFLFVLKKQQVDCYIRMAMLVT